MKLLALVVMKLSQIVMKLSQNDKQIRRWHMICKYCELTVTASVMVKKGLPYVPAVVKKKLGPLT